MADFGKTFIATLDEIEARAKGAGMTKTDVAKAGGVSRAAFSRWRRQLPETVQVVEKMQRAVAAKRPA